MKAKLSPKKKTRKTTRKSTKKTTRIKKVSTRNKKSKVVKKVGPSHQWNQLVAKQRLVYYIFGIISLVGGLTFFIFQNFHSSNQARSIGNLNLPTPPLRPIETSKIEDYSLEGAFAYAVRLNIQERMNYWSNLLESDKKLHSDLMNLSRDQVIGDIAPLVPTAFDCTTFVETTAALARSHKVDEFINNLLAIRYHGDRATFETRNHFPEADWIPNNQAAKILTDITGVVADGDHVPIRFEGKVIDKPGWLTSQLKRNGISRSIASALPKNWEKPVAVTVRYIELQDVKKIVSHIPNGTVINLVHKDSPKHPVLISHQGLIIHNAQGVFIRHASTGGRIHTISLVSYLQTQQSKHGPHTRWPLLGINLIQINDSASTSSFLTESKKFRSA